MVFAAVFASVVSAVTIHWESEWSDDLEIVFTPFTALGVAISLFLGFRNNASYDRWWESRKQWGKQLIVIRNLSRLLEVALGCEHEARRAVLLLAAAHSHAMRAMQRPAGEAGVAARADRNRYLTETEQECAKQSANPADYALRQAAKHIRSIQQTGSVDGYTVVALMRQIDALGEVQGACERLSATPIPFAYTLLVHRTVYLYVILAPFALTETMRWYTPLFNTIMAYTFFGLDELANLLERPFDANPIALPLQAICRTIEVSIAEALGDPTPEMLKPINNVIM